MTVKWDEFMHLELYIPDSSTFLWRRHPKTSRETGHVCKGVHLVSKQHHEGPSWNAQHYFSQGAFELLGNLSFMLTTLHLNMFCYLGRVGGLMTWTKWITSLRKMCQWLSRTDALETSCRSSNFMVTRHIAKEGLKTTHVEFATTQMILFLIHTSKKHVVV